MDIRNIQCMTMLIKVKPRFQTPQSYRYSDFIQTVRAVQEKPTGTTGTHSELMNNKHLTNTF